MIHSSSSPSGFTLVETIISVGLLALSIIGPIMLASQSIRASRDAQQHLEAIHLAEEGVEIIHSMRDNNSGQDNSTDRNEWLTGINCATGCAVDAQSASTGGSGGNVWGSQAIVPITCGLEGSCAVVRYDPSTGTYCQNCPASIPVSPFNRRVTTTAIAGKPQVRVVSVVAYRSAFGGGMKYATATTDIYNWFPELSP